MASTSTPITTLQATAPSEVVAQLIHDWLARERWNRWREDVGFSAYVSQPCAMTEGPEDYPFMNPGAFAYEPDELRPPEWWYLWDEPPPIHSSHIYVAGLFYERDAYGHFMRTGSVAIGVLDFLRVDHARWLVHLYASWAGDDLMAEIADYLHGLYPQPAADPLAQRSDGEDCPSEPNAAVAGSPLIPGRKGEYIRLWREGKTEGEIARLLGVEAKSVHKRIGELRREHGTEVVPWRRPPEKAG